MVPSMIRRCYPGGALKAFNVTYDDGVTQDVRFVALLDRYGMKGTFNLNAQLMEERFEWVHDCGMVIKRLSPEEAIDIYGDHEIASHTLTHPYMRGKTDEELLWELGEDKRRLEKLFGREVAGFAVPFHYYSQKIAAIAKRCGFVYGRCSEESRSYSPYQLPYRWEAGIFHLSPELDTFVDGFFSTDQELALCQIVGHSYDLDVADMWDKMESVFRAVAASPDVLPMTHIELVRYLDAMGFAVFYDGYIENRSEERLWFQVDGTVMSVEAGEKRSV